MATLAFWILLLAFMGAFAAQVARRVQLIAAAPNTFSLDQLGLRTSHFIVDVLLQWRTIKERPLTGLMHAFVFWGFVAFGGYTLTEFLQGLGIVDLTHTGWFRAYRLVLTPFAAAVLLGILYLFIRINVSLMIFNLIPLPPLDGSHVLLAVVDPRTSWRLRTFLTQYGSLILLGLILLPSLTNLPSPLRIVFEVVANPIISLLTGQ